LRIGIQTAPLGTLADPAAVGTVALAAEQLGYASLWVVDRRSGLDPLALLGALAATTRRIRLGTGVLVAPGTDPARLARSLASVDVLSEGRLDVGLGGDGQDGPVGPALDDVLDLVEAHWRGEPRPVQRPRPPLLLAGTGATARDLVARRGDGWIPAGLPIEVLGPRWADLRHRAAAHGRDPDGLRLVVRAEVDLVAAPLAPGRPPYHGSIEQVVDDVAATRRAGASEVVVGLREPAGVDRLLDACARIAEAVEAVGAP